MSVMDFRHVSWIYKTKLKRGVLTVQYNVNEKS